MQRKKNNEAKNQSALTVVAFCAISSLSLLALVDRGIFFFLLCQPNFFTSLDDRLTMLQRPSRMNDGN